MSTFSRVIVASLAIAIAGCSSSSSGDSAATNPDQACNDAAAAVCAAYQRCTPFFVDLGWGDLATCQTRTKASCTSTLSATGSTMTAQQVSDCGKGATGISCADLFDKGAPDACVPPAGTVANGKACGDDAQCVSTFCAIASGTLCGTCAPLTNAGDACVSGQCSRHLGCIAGKCVKPGALGDACDARNAPCGTALSCFSGKCVAAAKAGDKCDAAEITAPNCDLTQGVGCNPGTKVCQKVIEAKAGESCGLVGSDFKVCVPGGRCKIAPGVASGTCIAPVADGASCGGADLAPCLSPAKCIGGVCKLPDPNSCK